MKTKLQAVLLVLLLYSCSSIKISSAQNEQDQQKNKKDAIQIAVQDFLNHIPKLSKDDSVFYVEFYDTVFNMVSERVDDRNSKWVRGDMYEDLMVVSIGASYSKNYFTPSDTITKSKMPSRFLEIESKLFYWWDDDYVLTDDAIEIFKKYGLIEIVENEENMGLPYIIDHSPEILDYYFCSNNLAEYKRVKPKYGIGYYKPPKLKCKP